MNDHQRKTILLLGDSLTQLSFDPQNGGFGAYLANVYQRRADVLNRGFSGYNTDWFLSLLTTSTGLRDIFGSSSPNSNVALITIFFGANDASDAILNPRHHVPIERYKSNLKRIANEAMKHCPNARIVMITPPPVHHEGRLQYQIDRYGDKATGKLERNMGLSELYARGAEEVAGELKLNNGDGVPCLNLWKAMQIGSDWGPKFLCDGLHFSKEGNELVGRLLLDVVRDNFPGLAIESCGITGYWGNSGSKNGDDASKFGPWHDEIDHKQPEDAFKKFDVKRKRDDDII